MDNGKAKSKGSIIYHGNFSINISLPNKAFEIPSGTASDLCKKVNANRLVNTPVHKLHLTDITDTFFFKNKAQKYNK